MVRLALADKIQPDATVLPTSPTLRYSELAATAVAARRRGKSVVLPLSR